MAGIPAVETRVPMKLKVPDGTEPPLGLDAWRALPGAERTAIRACYEQNVHVRVQGSGLHAACPSLPYVIDNDVAYLPLHIVESFYVRLMRLAPGVRHDLTVMVDPAALAEVERIALEKGLDASPTTPTVYLQRLQALSLHLRDAVFPTADRDDDDVAALTLDNAKLLDAEPHADDVYEESWHVRIRLDQLVGKGSMLSPLADYVNLIGPRDQCELRVDEEERAGIAAAALAHWRFKGGVYDRLWEVYPQYPAAVAALWRNSELPLELMVANIAFPDVLDDVDARASWDNPDWRTSLLSRRFATVAPNFEALADLLAEVEAHSKYDTAAHLVRTVLGSAMPMSLASLRQLERHVAADATATPVSAGGSKVDGFVARLERDTRVEAASRTVTASGGAASSSGGGGGGPKNGRDAQCFHPLHISSTLAWLKSPDVVGPLVYLDDGDADDEDSDDSGMDTSGSDEPRRSRRRHRRRVDEDRSGLIALMEHAKGDNIAILGIAFRRRRLPIVQFLVHDGVCEHELFRLLGDARPHLAEYISRMIVTRNSGGLEEEDDDTFLLDDAVVKKILLGKWSEVNWHDDVLAARCDHRSEPVVRSGKIANQFATDAREDVAECLDRAIGALGYGRNGCDTFLAFARDAFKFRSNARLDAVKYIDKAITAAVSQPARSWASWSTGPPNAKFPQYLTERSLARVQYGKALKAKSALNTISAVYRGMSAALDGGAAGAADATAAGAAADADGGAKVKSEAKRQRDKERRAKKEAEDDARKAKALKRDAAKPKGQGPSFTWTNVDGDSKLKVSWPSGDTATFDVPAIKTAYNIKVAKCWPTVIMHATSNSMMRGKSMDEQLALARERWCPCKDQHAAGCDEHKPIDGLDSSSLRAYRANG